MKIHIYLAAVLAVLAVPAWPARTAVALTVEGAVEYALENNTSIKKAKHDLENAHIQLVQAVNVYLPSVDLSFSYTGLEDDIETDDVEATIDDGNPMTPPMTMEIPGSVMSYQHDFKTKLQVRQPLFSWQWFTMPPKALTGLATARAAYDISRSLMAGNVRKSFYGCVYARENIALVEASIRQAKTQLKITRDKYNAGKASRHELLNAQVRLDTLTPSLLSARRAYRDALLNLKKIMRYPLEKELDLKGELAPEFKTYHYDKLIKQARRDNRALRLTEYQNTLSEIDRWSALGGLMPSAFLTYSQTMPMNDDLYPGIIGEGYDGDDEDSWALNLTVSVPLSEAVAPWGRTWTGFLMTGKNAEKTRLDREDAEKSLVIGLKKTLLNLETAHKSILSTRQTVGAARQNLEIQQSRYRNGQASGLELLNAEYNLNNARTNLLKAKYDYLSAQIDLELFLKAQVGGGGAAAPSAGGSAAASSAGGGAAAAGGGGMGGGRP